MTVYPLSGSYFYPHLLGRMPIFLLSADLGGAAMRGNLIGTEKWAKREFGDVDLGDKRRERRLVEMAKNLAESPGGTLPTALPDGKSLKAAYRLLDCEEVTYERVLGQHFGRTRSICCGGGNYLLVEDTSQLDYTKHYAMEGLGRIGDDKERGLHLHPTLALSIEGWNGVGLPEVGIVGLFGQKCWARTMPTKGRGKEGKRLRLQRERESQRWGKVLWEEGGPPPGATWTYVADRESDIYETLLGCKERGIDFIVRAAQCRVLQEEEGSVFDLVRRSPVVGYYEVEVPARAGAKARKAKMEVRTCEATLRPPQRPGKKLPPITVNVVEAREIEALTDVEEPLQWVLLTSWPVETLAQARRVIGAYTRRWLIEEYFKMLKTGVRVEESRLRTADRLKPLLGILSLVALRLMEWKMLARVRPNDPIDLDNIDPDIIQILESKWGHPRQGWTNESFIVAVARTGGFLARKGDGPPGCLTIWRGWQKLTLMLQGYGLAVGQ